MEKVPIDLKNQAKKVRLDIHKNGYKMLDIIAEPEGETYTELLRFALQYCSSFSLSCRDQLKFNESASLLISSLRPLLIREVYNNEWPGTVLLGHKAIVRHYQFTEKTLKILTQAPSLYAWLSPDFPEDLALYRPDKDCWLFTIAHEKEAAILDEEITIDELAKTLPNLWVKSRA